MASTIAPRRVQAAIQMGKDVATKGVTAKAMRSGIGVGCLRMSQPGVCGLRLLGPLSEHVVCADHVTTRAEAI